MPKTVTRLIFSFFFCFLFLPAASAQMVGTASQSDEKATLPNVENLTSEQSRDLLSRLSDQEVREILLKQLDTVSAGKNAQPSEDRRLLDLLSKTIVGVGQQIFEAVVTLPKIPSAVYTGFDNFFKKHGWQGIGVFVGVLALSFALGFAAEMCVNQFARKWRGQIGEIQEKASLLEAFKLLGLRLTIDIAGLLAFFAVAAIIGELLMPEPLHPATALLVSNLIVFPRVIGAVGRFVLAPDRPDLRLVYTDDETARYIQRNMIGLAFLLGFTKWFIHFLLNNGIQFGDVHIGFWFILVFYAWLAYVAYHARSGLAVMMAGKPDGPVSAVEGKLSAAYPWFVIILTLFTWLVVQALAANKAWHLLDGRAELTLIILLMAPAMNTLIRGLVKHRLTPLQGEGVLAEQAYASAKNCYFRIGRIISFGVAILFISSLWDIDFSQLASAGVGARAAAALFQFLLIIAFGYLVWEVVMLWINRKLAAELTSSEMDLNSEEPGGGEGGGAGSSRLSTILPLVRFCLQSAIIVITILVALGEIGIEIAPLLAGAGILGLAIGFGAQKLVADVVSGVFFLVDDAFRAGEYVEIDGTFGTVEKISLRSMQLRHHKGPVHTIPYGEIPKITNFSRDWAIMKLRFTVPFDTDPTKVKKIFKKIGKEMMAVPEYAEDFLQPFKSQGVLEVNDVGIVMRGKFMAKPGTQFTLRKEIYHRIQREFEAAGLQFARKEVRVKIDSDKDGLTEEDKHAIAAAAAEASDTAEKAP